MEACALRVPTGTNCRWDLGKSGLGSRFSWGYHGVSGAEQLGPGAPCPSGNTGPHPHPWAPATYPTQTGVSLGKNENDTLSKEFVLRKQR